MENERRILTERLESAQQAVGELRRNNQTLGDQNIRLQNEISNNEVVRSGLEAQLRLSNWPHEERTNKEEELVRQVQSAQRDRSELKGKVDALHDKVFNNCNDICILPEFGAFVPRSKSVVKLIQKAERASIRARRERVVGGEGCASFVRCRHSFSLPARIVRYNDNLVA